MSKRISNPYLTKYEWTQMVGFRSGQLERGVEPLVPFDTFDSRVIAEEEIRKKLLRGWIVRRKLPENKVEYFTLDELIVLY